MHIYIFFFKNEEHISTAIHFNYNNDIYSLPTSLLKFCILCLSFYLLQHFNFFCDWKQLQFNQNTTSSMATAAHCEKKIISFGPGYRMSFHFPFLHW